MLVLICGTRNKEPRERLEMILSKLLPGDVVMHGDGRGVDRCADRCARARGLHVLRYPADWNNYGLSAGPRRNQTMLEKQPDIVIAVHNDPGLGRGTRDMVTRARAAGIPVVVLSC